MEGQLSKGCASSISTLEMDFQHGNTLFFGKLARFLWPKDTHKADHELALRTGATTRMCRNWIDGANPPNGRAVRAVFGEILRRLD